MSLIGHQQQFVTGAEEGSVTTIKAPQAEERLFVVYQKGKGGTQVLAETCRITDHGVLVFQSGGHLVMAFSPGGWTFMEEGDPEDAR